MSGSNGDSPHRAATLALFQRYLEGRASLAESVGHPDTASTADLELLTRQVKQLADNRFVLAVVGESKSGKSTFINALAGASLLPTGALQCTSAIIEIVDSRNDNDQGAAFLKVRYGDSDAEHLEFHHPKPVDATGIRSRLGTLAAMRDAYRALPVNQLSQALLADRPDRVTSAYIDSLLALQDADGNELLENPYKLPRAEFRQRVKDYLFEYRDLKKIPVHITVGYPIGFGFADLRIVDTPGVNARGGLQDTTLRYLCDANAVLFVHTLRNIASDSFRRFFVRAIPEQAKKNTFLILTHRFPAAPADVEACVLEATRLFPKDEVLSSRITAVDGVLKLAADRLGRGTSVDELLNDPECRHLIASFVLTVGKDPVRLRELLLEESRIPHVYALLRDFAKHAHARQIEWLLERIGQGLAEHIQIYADTISMRRAKLEKSPEEFGRDVDALKAILDDYLAVLNDFSRALSNDAQKSRDEFIAISDQYKRHFREAENLDEIRKLLIDFNRDCERALGAHVQRLQQAYEAKMTEVGTAFEAKHHVVPPKITLDDVSERARELSYDVITVPGDQKARTAGGGVAGALLGGLKGFFVAGPVGALVGAAVGAAAGGSALYVTSTPARTQRVLNHGKHLHEIKNISATEVEKARNALVESMKSTFAVYSAEFDSKLRNVITLRQNAYELLKTRKEDADTIVRAVERLNHHRSAALRDCQVITHIRSVL